MMDAKKMREVLERYEKELTIAGAECLPFSHGELDPTAAEVQDHLLDMINRQLAWGEECIVTNKSNRWLGFVQGALWAIGEYTIDDLKDHNRPLKEELAGL